MRNVFNEEAGGYVEVFRRLGERGVITLETSEGMQKLARLRNLILHRYWRVDARRVYEDAHSSGLTIVENFVKEVRSYVRGYYKT